MYKLIATLAVAVAGGVGTPTSATTTELPDCPPSTVIIVPAGVRPRCDLTGSQRLDIRFVGSDGVERRHFRRVCNLHGGQLVWVIPGGVVGDGEFQCEDWDY